MNKLSIEKRLTKSDIIGLNECFSPTVREYTRGEIITICSPDSNTIGIIKSGTAYLVTINSNDQRRIMDYYEQGQMFGKHFLPDTEDKLFYIMAKTKCEVAFIKYSKILHCCEKRCQKHQNLIDSLIMVTARKSFVHVDILGQKTLRSKLLTFFHYLSDSNGLSQFTLPLPYSDLADYLAVDRSALMRELKALNAEKIIVSNKKEITLLKK